MATRGLFCLVGLTLAMTLPAEAGRGASGEYRLEIASRAVLGKSGIHEFTVRVRDREGRPVPDADVRLRLHSFGPERERLVPLRPVGRGYYRTVARLHAGQDSENPRYTRVLVRPAAGR